MISLSNKIITSNETIKFSKYMHSIIVSTSQYSIKINDNIIKSPQLFSMVQDKALVLVSLHHF